MIVNINVYKEIAELKEKKEGVNKYDKGPAIVTIISGAGGDDAEDFSAMLFAMYEKYARKKSQNRFRCKPFCPTRKRSFVCFRRGYF